MCLLKLNTLLYIYNYLVNKLVQGRLLINTLGLKRFHHPPPPTAGLHQTLGSFTILKTNTSQMF